MSVVYNASVSLDIVFNAIVAQGNLVNGPLSAAFREHLDLITGTSDTNINVAVAKSESGIGATTTTYDLVGGIQSIDGSSTINFDEVVLIAIKNRGTTATQYLTIGPDPTNGFGVIASNVGFWAAALGSGGGSVVTADGGSWQVMYCKGGVPAAAGSTDELSVVTTGTGNAWDLLILGRDNP